MLVLPRQLSGKERHVVANEAFGTFLVSGRSVWDGEDAAQLPGVGVGGKGLNDRAGLAEAGIVQSYLQTLVLFYSWCSSSRLIFLPVVTSERRKATETEG